MKPLYLLLPLWLVIAVYALLSFLWGDHGLVVMKRLEVEKMRLERNLDELSTINAALESRMKALESDSELISLEARKLGWGLENESQIRLVGRRTRRDALNAGIYLEAARPDGVDDMTLKTIALLFSLFASMIGAGLRLRRQREKTAITARACEGAAASSEYCRPR